DKSDIEDAFAAVYTTSNNHKIIYFGGDRISNSGSENTAFWFLQKAVGEKPNTSGGFTINSGCPLTGQQTAAQPGKDKCLTPQGQTTGVNMSTGGSCTESDNGVGKPSTDAGGDVLIVSAFSIGGTQPTTTAYEWVGVGNAPKSLCITSKCSVIKISKEEPGCEPEGLGSEPVCAITNQNIQYAKCPSGGSCVAGNAEPIKSPWLYTEKSSDTASSGASVCTVASNKMCPGAYFEGGLDLTALGLGEECTASFTMDTRSSASVDASLQDLAVGQLGKCESSIETTAGTAAGSVPTEIEK